MRDYTTEQKIFVIVVVDDFVGIYMDKWLIYQCPNSGELCTALKVVANKLGHRVLFRYYTNNSNIRDLVGSSGFPVNLSDLERIVDET